MAWMITKDHVENGKNSGRIFGHVSGDSPESVDERLPHKFLLFDDDDELYYEGRSDDNDSEAAFEPLDWAENYAGCTYICYLRGRDWRIL